MPASSKSLLTTFLRRRVLVLSFDVRICFSLITEKDCYLDWINIYFLSNLSTIDNFVTFLNVGYTTLAAPILL
jgi:hypothetical protein